MRVTRRFLQIQSQEYACLRVSVHVLHTVGIASYPGSYFFVLRIFSVLSLLNEPYCPWIDFV